MPFWYHFFEPQPGECGAKLWVPKVHLRRELQLLGPFGAQLASPPGSLRSLRHGKLGDDFIYIYIYVFCFYFFWARVRLRLKVLVSFLVGLVEK